MIGERQRGDELRIRSDLIGTGFRHDRCDEEATIGSRGGCDLVDLLEDDDTSCRRADEHDEAEDETDDIA